MMVPIVGAGYALDSAIASNYRRFVSSQFVTMSLHGISWSAWHCLYLGISCPNNRHLPCSSKSREIT